MSRLLLSLLVFNLSAFAGDLAFRNLSVEDHTEVGTPAAPSSTIEGHYKCTGACAFTNVNVKSWAHDYLLEANVVYGPYEFPFSVFLRQGQDAVDYFSGNGTFAVRYTDGSACNYEIGVYITVIDGKLYIKDVAPSSVPRTARMCATAGPYRENIHADPYELALAPVPPIPTVPPTPPTP